MSIQHYDGKPYNRICGVGTFRTINFTQAGAVQNTWYTAATLYDSHILGIAGGCTVANETVDMRITVDGNPISLTGIAMVAGAFSTINYIDAVNPAALVFTSGAGANLYIKATGDAPIRGHVIVIEIRKTTNTGASALRVVGVYEGFP